MIALLHGYLLDGSGSNLWTQAVARSLCRIGEDVHVVCQERHPDRYDFVAEARVHPRGGIARGGFARGGTAGEVLFQRDTPFPGRCVLHRPELGDTLPVYVTDDYDGFERVVPMVDLGDAEIEAYLERNVAVVDAIVEAEGITALHANHAVLMSVVAERVAGGRGIPFAVMPHGSALEYAVKPDPRFRAMARGALTKASVVFVIGDEMTRRLADVFPDLPALSERMVELPLGVDVDLFQPLDRDARLQAVEALTHSLTRAERGHGRSTDAALTEALAAHPDGAGLESLWAEASSYEGKLPDAGLEEALAGVDRRRDGILLYVGRLIAAKGVQYVVAALPEILRSRPAVRLLLVGHGPLREPLESMVWALENRDELMLRRVVEVGGRVEDDHGPEGFHAVAGWLDAVEERDELDAYLDAAATARLSERVLFTGYLTHDRLRHLFSAADVAIFPSRVREAGPLVDRMKLRTPDAPQGGIVADIASAVIGTLEDPSDNGPRLRGHVERRHDWRAVARRLKEALEQRQPG